MNLRQGGPTGAAADASFGIDQQARVDQANGGFMAVGELARQMIARAGARSGLEHGNRNAQFRGRNLDVQLSTFSARGTKQMLIHGMSDPFFGPEAPIGPASARDCVPRRAIDRWPRSPDRR